MFARKAEHLKERRKKNCANAILAISIMSAVIAAGAIILAGIMTGYATRNAKAETYVASGALVNTPFKHFFDAAGAPLAMVLPNDLSGYVSKTYHIYSRTSQPHTVTIAAGPLTTTFDGVNTIATFGGAVGDGFVMTVIDKNRIVVESSINVAFS